MPFTAFDFQPFVFTQLTRIYPRLNAFAGIFGFCNEIHFVLHLFHHRPIGIVVAQRGRDFEPAGQFEVKRHAAFIFRIIILAILGKSLFRAGIQWNIVFANGFLRFSDFERKAVFIKLDAFTLHVFQQLLVVHFAGLFILDSCRHQCVQAAVYRFGGKVDEALRVACHIFQTTRLCDDFVHRAPRQPRFSLDFAKYVGNSPCGFYIAAAAGNFDCFDTVGL